MPANVSFNPILQTTALGTFDVQTDGYIQGVYMDDPAVRYALAGGIVAGTETLPMWGGIALFEDIPGAAGAPAGNLGSIVGRAQSNAAIAGFSVFNQASNWITSPQSEAPSAGNFMGVNFFRLGSGARIPVACDPTLAAALRGGATNQQVGWDINNQILAPYTATATYAISSATWANTSGGQITIVMSVASPVAGVGDEVNISGATNSGTGGAAAVNGNFVVVGFTDDEHFVLAAPAAAGVIGTIGGSPVLNYGTGALACKVLDFNVGNSKTILYDPVNNFVHWNPTGSCALIQI